MELWIRSQDKEALIKADKIFYWNTCPEMPNTGKHYLGNKEWVGNADYTKLGEYNTKERALEILDEIQEILKPKIIAHIRPSNEMIELLGSRQAGKTMKMNTDTEIKELSTYVFEMPKE